VLEIRPAGPISAYANVALNHAYGYGPITGGFFPDWRRRRPLTTWTTISACRWSLVGCTRTRGCRADEPGPVDPGDAEEQPWCEYNPLATTDRR